MTETDRAYGDDFEEGRAAPPPWPADESATEAESEAPDLIPDVVPTDGMFMPGGLPLMPNVGPELAGPNDPVEP